MPNYNAIFADLEKLGITTTIDSCGVESFSSGVFNIDRLTGINGYPIGRIIELFGSEMSGKSYLALRAIKSMQQKMPKDYKCAYLDLEQSFDPEWAKTVGVDIDRLILIRPDYAEQALDAARRLTEGCPLIVIDSTAALVPKDEIEGSLEDTTVGLLARVMSKALRVLVQAASSNKSTIIFINQLREKISMPGRPVFGDPVDTPGGRALKFYSSVRLRVERGKLLKNESEKDAKVIGHEMSIKIVKNKCGSPMGSTVIPFYYGVGLDDLGGVIDYALSVGLIKRSGNKYVYKDQSWIGYDALYKGMSYEQLVADLSQK